MIFKHTCLYCSHPCEYSGAVKSENCTNPKCDAYAPALKALEEPKPEAVPPGHASIPEHPTPRNFNKEIQREAAALMETDPLKMFAALPCPHCQAKSMRVREGMGRPRSPRDVHCFGCGTTYDRITVDNTLHDELVFSARPTQTGVAGLRLDKRDEKLLITKDGKTIGIEGTKTGRLSSTGPNVSNIPRANVPVQDLPIDDPRSPYHDKPGFRPGDPGGHPPPRPRVLRFNEGMSQPLSEWTKEIREGKWSDVAADHQINDKVFDLPWEGSSDYEMKRLRWPQTMRVLDREMEESDAAHASKGKMAIPLMGVLSLVDVDRSGDNAFYDYIALKSLTTGHDDVDPSRTSSRLRVEVQKLLRSQKPFQRPTYAKKFESKIGDRENFQCRVVKNYESDRHSFPAQIHMPAIVLEFELDRVRDRPVRLPNLGERVLFEKIRSRK